jgi:alanine dehydrogenase
MIPREKLSIGLPRMHLEPGERRDFLPGFVAYLQQLGWDVVLESNYGSGMGYSEEDYLDVAGQVKFADLEEVYSQNYILVLRYPGDVLIKLMRPGACLISMLHYPTRPDRVAYLNEMGLRGISLDTIKDDSGKRLIENLKAVAWNGLQVAFEALGDIYPPPGFESPQRPPIRVTVLGAGAVGKHVVQAAVSYGNPDLRERLASNRVPGVQVTVVDYDLTGFKDIMRDILTRCDILIDATQRPDSSKPVILNSWLSWLPEHAIITDLAVDPYTLDADPPVVRGIEGIPQGNLDKLIFESNDPDWEKTVPASVPSKHRRTVVSCYSWPGTHPEECMLYYAQQLKPLMAVLFDKGYDRLSPDSDFFERALYRGTLKAWSELEG